MIDYYSILLRAVSASGAGDARWRRALYQRARQMLANRMRAERRPATMAELADEQAALEASIERIEAELASAEHGAVGTDSGVADEYGEIAGAPRLMPERGVVASPPARPSRAAWLLLAVVAAALGAGAYTYWAESTSNRTIENRATEAATGNDLAPGIDGGSSDVDLPYVFRRQPTFYRTPQPAGTIIVDKLQHFLYLTRPNNVALRYGIAVGDECAELAGLRHIARMTEWPQWQPPPDLTRRKIAAAGAMPGGLGNPLGARLLELDDGRSRIHGTNAPKTIGSFVVFGCIRLVNDDIVDLYGRVQAGTPVVIN